MFFLFCSTCNFFNMNPTCKFSFQFIKLFIQIFQQNDQITFLTSVFRILQNWIEKENSLSSKFKKQILKTWHIMIFYEYSTFPDKIIIIWSHWKSIYREKKSGHTALNLLCINTLLLNINMFTEFVIASLNEIKAKWPKGLFCGPTCSYTKMCSVQRLNKICHIYEITVSFTYSHITLWSSEMH